jgi:hypothetical protein
MKQKIPDPKLHQQISFVKSLLRLAAGIFLILYVSPVSGALLVAAEILGIIEELV